MTREEYARNYSTSHAMDHGRSVIVPENIQRVSEQQAKFEAWILGYAEEAQRYVVAEAEV
jgi:hypothetical protein